MNQKIEWFISNIVKDFTLSQSLPNPIWKRPLVSFCDASDPLFEKFTELVHPEHYAPHDILEDAVSIIAFFVPFDEVVVESNVGSAVPSQLWSDVYTETNEMIEHVSNEFQSFANGYGFDSSVIPATANFKEDELKSQWSHKHVAYVAGLGTFGVNKLLITENGCCGRIGTIVTNIDGLEYTERIEGKENCLYKRNEGEEEGQYKCLECVDSCIMGALEVDDFDRFGCFELLKKNKKRLGENVCGKCSVGVPCSYEIP